jgi:hypothetical protein
MSTGYPNQLAAYVLYVLVGLVFVFDFLAKKHENSAPTPSAPKEGDTVELPFSRKKSGELQNKWARRRNLTIAIIAVGSLIFGIVAALSRS